MVKEIARGDWDDPDGDRDNTVGGRDDPVGNWDGTVEVGSVTEVDSVVETEVVKQVGAEALDLVTIEKNRYGQRDSMRRLG
ncbi:hypothetical protein U1Q18_005885 [Sarracenia purpurea var. burkii]